MSTYKVIQDIEAEDKFVGPLTLRQFIYAAVFVVCAYLSFLLITKHVWFLAIPFLPFMIFTGFLAFPWGRDQPTEIWLLAKISFYFKPHRRIWDQTGVQELVTITAPKKLDQQLTKDLTQTEVKSRLKALADTIDSRGWVLKDVSVNEAAQNGFNAAAAVAASDDRLVAAPVSAIVAPITDVQAADDILDEANNPTAQKLDQMIDEAAQARREALLQGMDKLRQDMQKPAAKEVSDGPAADYWFMHESAKTEPGYKTFSAQTITPGTTVETSNAPLSDTEKGVLDKIHREQEREKKVSGIPAHERVLQPLSRAEPPKPKSARKAATPPVTHTPDPDILKLAINNDRNVASLAREATANRKQDPPDEVVISLH